MYKWGMVIDLDKCTACQACVVSCQEENLVPFADAGQAELGRIISWITLIPMSGEPGNPTDAVRTGVKFIPRLCNHCENAPCIKVCPTGATYKNEEGIVSQIHRRCIGCRYCTVACPYAARYFNWSKPKFDQQVRRPHNTHVSIRTKGVVEKCTFCVQRIRAAKERAEIENRPLRDGDIQTACQQTCPSDAIRFGDYNDPESEVSMLSKSPRAFRLLEELDTHPKVIYLRGGK